METLPSLLGLDLAQLPSDGPDYRRKQLAGWLYERGAGHFEEMSNLPQAWRESLAAQYTISPFVRLERFPSRDNSVRYLFTLTDGKQTEAVLHALRGPQDGLYLLDGGLSGGLRLLRHGRTRLRA